MKKVILFWLMSLVVMAVVASTLTRAQTRLNDEGVAASALSTLQPANERNRADDGA